MSALTASGIVLISSLCSMSATRTTFDGVSALSTRFHRLTRRMRYCSVHSLECLLCSCYPDMSRYTFRPQPRSAGLGKQLHISDI